MTRRNRRNSEAELETAMAEIEQSVGTATPSTRFTSLCLMAVIVARYPPGDSQDEAEDRLAAAMAESDLGQDDLAVIRRFRRDGLEADMRRLSLSRTISPRLRHQF